MFARLTLLIACLLAACYNDAAAADCAADEDPISVVNATKELICVKKSSCSGQSDRGNCPGPVKGALEFGSYCGKLNTGVHGCIALLLLPAIQSNASAREDDSAPDCSLLPNQTQVTVEGVGNLCARIPICSGSTFNGNCPTTLTDLDKTYACVKKDAGDYGCVL